MRALRAALGLLLLGALQAFPQDRAPRDTCVEDPKRYYDEATGRCCYRCPEGLSPQLPCPQGPADCRKRCKPDYYLNEAGRCTACVSCSRGDLVEKRPCSQNSPRVCECRPGMFCATSASQSCARCSKHSVCPPGKIVKLQGTAERDTICQLPSSGPPDCNTNPEDCRAPASTSILQVTSTPTSPATAGARTMLPGEGTALAPEVSSESLWASSSPFSMEKPGPGPGLSLQLPSPQDSADGTKRCKPDYYLDAAGRCTACVSCSRDDLVEKTPCTWNSSRICECRPGMFCATPATNSCARCSNHCPPGMIVKPPECGGALR